MEKKIRNCLERFLSLPTASLELGLSAILWAMGTWLLLPLRTFAEQPEIFKTLAAIMPEEGWGSIGVFIGLSYWLGFFTNCWKLRRYSMLFVFCIWLTVAAGFVWHRPSITATPIYLILSTLSAWSYLRMEEHES